MPKLLDKLFARPSKAKFKRHRPSSAKEDTEGKLGKVNASADAIQSSNPSAPDLASQTAFDTVDKPSDGHERVILEPFKPAGVEPDSDLAIAHESLHVAMEKLEAVLQKTRPSDRYGQKVQEAMTNGRALDPSVFTDLAKVLQSSHDESKKSIPSKVGGFMMALYPVSKLVLGLTGNAGGITGWLPLQITANGLAQILEILVSPHRNTEAVLGGLSSLMQDQRLLDRLSCLAKVDHVDESILVRAVYLQTALTDFLRESVLWLGRPYISKASSAAIGREPQQDAKSALQKAQEALRVSISDDLYLTVKWRDLESHNRQALDKRLRNTGTGIMNHAAYQRWCSGELSTLWCPGLAGAGKTFAASAVVEDLELRFSGCNVGLAFFYCQFDMRQQQNPASVISAITRQLMARNVDLCSKIPDTDQLLDFAEHKKLLMSAIKSFGVVFVVVDAMDEFSSDHDQRIRLAELLVNLRVEATSSRLRICVTSREANDIFEALSPASKVPVRASEEEITQYIRTKLSESAHARRMMEQDPELLEDINRMVVNKSDKIFKLASLQLDHVIKASSPQDARDTLAHLKTDINSYYKIAIDRINAKPEKEKQLIIKLLTWVFYFRRRLLLPELSIALAIGKKVMDFERPARWVISDLHYYISGSKGLLITPTVLYRPAHVVVESCIFAHETVEAFFGDNKGLLLANGNCAILETCIDFHMQSGLKFLNIGGSCNQFSVEELINRCSDAKSTTPEFYSDMLVTLTQSWGDYAEAALSEDPQITIKIEKFLNMVDAAASPHIWPPWKAIHYCAFSGWSVLCRLLIKGVDPNSSSDSMTPLFVAMEGKGNECTINVFLDDPRTDPNRKCGHLTPLIYAVQRGLTSVIPSFLGRNDIAVNDVNDEGESALMIAVKLRNLEIVRLLSAHPEIKVNKRARSGQSVLMRAINPEFWAQGNEECIQSLLSVKDLDVNAQDENGLTALHVAMIGGKQLALDLCEINKQERNPYHVRHAFENARDRQLRQHVAAKSLISCGSIKINVADNAGRTPLDYAVAAHKFSNELRLLIEAAALEFAGQDISRKDYKEGHGSIRRTLEEQAALSYKTPVQWYMTLNGRFASYHRVAYYMTLTLDESIPIIEEAGGRTGSPFELEIRSDLVSLMLIMRR